MRLSCPIGIAARIIEPYLEEWTLEVRSGGQVKRSYNDSGTSVSVVWDGVDAGRGPARSKKVGTARSQEKPS